MVGMDLGPTRPLDGRSSSPVNPRHLHIRDQAGGAIATIGFQKALARRERVGGKRPSDFISPVIASRIDLIVVDDRKSQFSSAKSSLPTSSPRLFRAVGRPAIARGSDSLAPEGKDRLVVGFWGGYTCV